LLLLLLLHALILLLLLLQLLYLFLLLGDEILLLGSLDLVLLRRQSLNVGLDIAETRIHLSYGLLVLFQVHVFEVGRPPRLDERLTFVEPLPLGGRSVVVDFLQGTTPNQFR
jgi:hypothetical protein